MLIYQSRDPHKGKNEHTLHCVLLSVLLNLVNSTPLLAGFDRVQAVAVLFRWHGTPQNH